MELWSGEGEAQRAWGENEGGGVLQERFHINNFNTGILLYANSAERSTLQTKYTRDH